MTFPDPSRYLITIWFCESRCTWTASRGNSKDFVFAGGRVDSRIGEFPESDGAGSGRGFAILARAAASWVGADRRSGAAMAGTGWMLISSSGAEAGEGGFPPPPTRSRELLQQLQNKLLLLVGLGKSGDAGLLQDGVLGKIGDRRGDVRGGNAVLCRGQVLHLIADHVAGTLQPVDYRADRAPLYGNCLDGGIDVDQGRLRRCRGEQIGSGRGGESGAVEETEFRACGHGRGQRSASCDRGLPGLGCGQADGVAR